MFAATFTSSHQSTPPGEIPKIAIEMLNAYARLMNDTAVLDQGFVGPERIPSDPSSVHSPRSGTATTSSRTASSYSQQVIRDLRKKARKQGLNFGDGLIRAADGNLLFWRGTKGKRSPAHELRAAADLELAVKRAARFAVKNRSKTFETLLSNGRLYAKAIRFESPRCLKCHVEAKVNDIAGVAAVVIAPPEFGSVNGRSIPQLLPKNVEAELGVGYYPGSRVLRSPRYVQKGKTDIYRVTLKTRDDPSAIRQYYLAKLRAHPGAIVREAGLRLNYEFGDRHYGSISVMRGKDVISIWLELFRITR